MKRSLKKAGNKNGEDLSHFTDETDFLATTRSYGRTMKLKSMKITDANFNQTGMMVKLRNSSMASPVEMDTINGTIKEEPKSPSAQLEMFDENIPLDERNLSGNYKSLTCHFSVGQLAWAQVGNYPYWPCVVTPDSTENSHAKIRNFGKTKSVLVHVQYFGDSCRHSWVYQRSIIPFTGIDDFHKLAETSNGKVKMKNGKIINPYNRPKPPTGLKWDAAIIEATDVLPMTNDERAEHFKPINGKSKYEQSLKLTNGKGKKRERLSDSGEPNAKRFKRDLNATERKVMEAYMRKAHKAVLRDEERMSMNTETPPTPPSSHNDSCDEWTIIKIKKRIYHEPEGEFELYYERTHQMIMDKRPDVTEDEVRIFLKRIWDTMSTEEKSGYTTLDVLSLDSLLMDQYDESSIESDSMDNDKAPKSTNEKKKSPKIRRKTKEPSTDHDEESSLESDSRDKKKSKLSKKKKSPKSARLKEMLTDQEEESSIESDSKYHRKRKIDKDETRMSDTAKKPPRPFNLFRGTKQERVCQICERTGDLTRCKGPCYSFFHLTCVKPGESSSECSMEEDTMDDELFQDLKEIKNGMINEDDDKSDEILEDETFKCIDCLSGVAPACFICNEREEDRLRCSASACGRHYHIECLKGWPQTHWQGGRLTCPYHMCHTCSSDNPQNGHTFSSNEKLVRCVRCPSSYHALTSCLPAGSEILTGNQIVCPKHYKALGPPLNATWCFLCTRGGSLICCDTCPTSFHPECLGIKPPDGAFICEDCETGRMPLYGEVVWVKLGSYRWWPSRICFPNEVPQNLEAISHRPGEFCVMFLGTNNYYWVHRGRAFLYQDGDSSAKVSSKVYRKNVDGAFAIALKEANEIHQRLKMERVAAKGSETRVLKPPPYVKLKVNKPVGNVKPAEVESIGACDCDAKWDNPCAPETDCLNRILSVECSPGICPAGPKCNNQAFVRRHYPAMEPFHTVGRGWGLRTLETITDGQFVVEYVGEVIDEAEYKRRLHHKKALKNENFYFLTIDQTRMIDAEPKGNLSRFMNHSCMPNCETQKWTVNGDTRIGLFALRDIEVGEELTFNYNLACDGETRKPCLCGAPNCSGFIGLKAQKQKGEEEKIEKIAKVEKAVKTEKVEKTVKTEKVEKTLKPEKGDKTSKTVKAEKSSKTEKVEKSSNAEKVEKTSKTEKVEKTSKTEKLSKTEKIEKFSRNEKTPKTEKVEKTPKTEKTSKTEKVEKTPKTVNQKGEKTPRTEKVAKTPKSEKVEKVAKAEKEEKTPKINRVVKMLRSSTVEKMSKAGKILKTAKVMKTPKSEKLDKTPKTRKIEKRYKKRRDEKPICWSCGESLPETDDYLECDQQTCFKRYHRKCVILEDPDFKFSCPWHHCKKCERRTGAHCIFCSTAYCFAHLSDHLVEIKDGKGQYVCKLHEGMESRKSLTYEENKEDTDNETEKDYSSLSSDSLLLTEKMFSLPRESSPRVTIVEVLQFSSEEGEESQKDEPIILENTKDELKEKKKQSTASRKKHSTRSSKRKKREQEERIKTLRSLTPRQLEKIIGGSINAKHNVHKR